MPAHLALVAIDPTGIAFRAQAQRDENARRDLMTLGVCSLLLMAYIESRYQYARRLAAGLGAHAMVEHYFADDAHPTYTEMRNFLIGECDANYVTACTAAFARVAMQNRYLTHSLGRAIADWHGGWHQSERYWL